MDTKKKQSIGFCDTVLESDNASLFLLYLSLSPKKVCVTCHCSVLNIWLLLLLLLLVRYGKGGRVTDGCDQDTEQQYPSPWSSPEGRMGGGGEAVEGKTGGR